MSKAARSGQYENTHTHTELQICGKYLFSPRRDNNKGNLIALFNTNRVRGVIFLDIIMATLLIEVSFLLVLVPPGPTYGVRGLPKAHYV